MCARRQSGPFGTGFWPLGRRRLSIRAAIFPSGAARLSHHAVSEHRVRRPSRDREQGRGVRAEGHRDGLHQAQAAALAVAVRALPAACSSMLSLGSLEQGWAAMSSESVGGIFGAVVAAIVLAVAILFGPIGQYGKPAKPAKVDTPAAAPAAPAAPAPRGPVIREVPNQ